MKQLYTPFDRILYIMHLPVGALESGLGTYCYYIEKAKLNGTTQHIMSEVSLEKFIKEYIESQQTTIFLFICMVVKNPHETKLISTKK